LEVLLPLLNKLKISLVPDSNQSKDKRPGYEFCGSIPDLDTEKFEEYLKESRKE